MDRQDYTDRSLFQYVRVLLSNDSLITLRTDVLDGAMIIVAIYTVNIFHPGLLLRTKAEKDLDTEMKNVGGSSPMAVPASSSNTTL